MNRYLIIFVILLVIIIGVTIGMVLFMRSNQQSSLGPGGTSTTVTLPTVPEPGGQSSGSDAEAAFQSQIPQDMQITLGTNVVVGDYSLQLWTDPHGGGEALLKYDTTQNKWTVVSWGGGEWAIDSLVAEGVPQNTAAVLLAGMPH
jgi:hypothetical protein